jgi:alcohol dehydrogenase (cytochrome c)
MAKYRLRLMSTLTVAALLVIPTSLTWAQTPGLDYRNPPAKDWPVVGGNWGNTRYSTLEQINTSNVADLKGAWMARLNGSGMDNRYSQQGTPVVRDGVMYIPTGQQDIFATNAKTGEILWEYNPDVDVKSPGGWRNRGVAVADGKVFAIRKDSYVYALDQKTGKLLWQTEISPELSRQGSKYLAAAPLYWDGVIYTGLSGSDSGVRGRLTALDANTGRELWRFYTVPGPGEFGHDTWEGDSWVYGGGAIWMMPVIDPDLGMIYFQVGNAFPDYDGSVRGGDNLFTGSVVALDAKTGQYRWHFQEVHHEIWDYDASNSPIIFDLTVNGQARKVLAHPNKTGWVYLLDRTNGQPLIGIEERPVPQDARQKTAATQPFPIGDSFVPQCPPDPVPGYPTGCIFTPFWDVPIIQHPGVLGGSDYSPISFNPQTGLLYVGATIMDYAFAMRTDIVDAEGKRQAVRGQGAFIPYGAKRLGNLTAMDPTTNKVVWQIDSPYPAGMGSGVMSTAGGVVFHGQADGNFVAYDGRTGKELWKFQTGFGADGPPITYEIDGEQYVAIATGGNNLGLSPRGDAVWAFKLGGKIAALNAPAAPPKAQILTSTLVKSDQVAIGRLWDSDRSAFGAPAEYSFAPERITVPLGATVTFTNEGELEHTATDQKGTWDTGVLKTGESASLTFNTAGSYVYFCQPHPWMVAEVLVQ